MGVVVNTDGGGVPPCGSLCGVAGQVWFSGGVQLAPPTANLFLQGLHDTTTSPPFPPALIRLARLVVYAVILPLYEG